MWISELIRVRNSVRQVLKNSCFLYSGWKSGITTLGQQKGRFLCILLVCMCLWAKGLCPITVISWDFKHLVSSFQALERLLWEVVESPPLEVFKTCLDDMVMWFSGLEVTVVVLGEWLVCVILKVFSNLDDSVILWWLISHHQMNE